MSCLHGLVWFATLHGVAALNWCRYWPLNGRWNNGDDGSLCPWRSPRRPIATGQHRSAETPDLARQGKVDIAGTKKGLP